MPFKFVLRSIFNARLFSNVSYSCMAHRWCPWFLDMNSLQRNFKLTEPWIFEIGYWFYKSILRPISNCWCDFDQFFLKFFVLRPHVTRYDSKWWQVSRKMLLCFSGGLTSACQIPDLSVPLSTLSAYYPRQLNIFRETKCQTNLTATSNRLV